MATMLPPETNEMVEERFEAMEREERRRAARRQWGGVPGAAEVVATAGTWGEVWSELDWLDEESDRKGDNEALSLLNTLVDRTPPGVEDLEDEESYGVWLTPAEVAAIERLTGVALGRVR